MSYFNIVAETNENTVVTQYEPVKKHSDVYQSEAELEAEFIRMLTEQGYEYINAHSEDDMIANLRKKLEELNDYVFSDSEWERFFKEYNWLHEHLTSTAITQEIDSLGVQKIKEGGDSSGRKKAKAYSG